jgi:hypothetical protein
LTQYVFEYYPIARTLPFERTLRDASILDH